MAASARDVGLHFQSFGEVLKVDMPLTRVGDRKGFAFIHFAYSESVDLALDEKIHKIKGKRVAVRKGLDQAEASEQTRNM